MKQQLSNDKTTETLLAQWQTCVEMADSVSQRRDAMNNLFVTLNLALTTAVSIMWDIKSVFLLSAGIVLCVIWCLFIRNFKQLNIEKYYVINELENNLPTKPFNDEWQRLNKNKIYKDGTSLELSLPIVFIIMYVGAIIVIFYSDTITRVFKCIFCFLELISTSF